MGRSTSPSGRSVGKRLSLSPLARFKSLPSISEQDGSPSRSVAKPCQLLISPELPASNGQLGPRPPEESTVDKLLREQEQERAQEEELARRTRQQVQERIERLTAEQLKQVHVQDEDDAEAEAEAENTDLLRALQYVHVPAMLTTVPRDVLQAVQRHKVWPSTRQSTTNLQRTWGHLLGPASSI